MKLCYWNAFISLERLLHLFFFCFTVLLFLNYYYAFIENSAISIVNLFVLIIILKLLYITEHVIDTVVKEERFHLIGLALFVLVIYFLPIPFWIVVTVNNFFGIMYFLFFHFHRKRKKNEDKLIRSYLSIVHIFFVIYLVTLNGQMWLFNHHLGDLVLLVDFIQFGIQSLLFILSILSYYLYSKKKEVKEFDSLLTDTLYFSLELRAEERNFVLNNEPSNGKRTKDKDAIIAEQIVVFFETNDAYLQSDFTLEILNSYISNSTIHQLSFVIHHNLHTKFYQIVAYYRIVHALKLLESQPSWTIVAVAESCGIKSVNTFNKYFKDLIGLSPVAYRILVEKNKR